MLDLHHAVLLVLAGTGLLEPWQWEALLRMGLCLAIGGAIGLEREFHGRPAGIRTHILLCLGCCTIMLVSMHFARLYEHLGTDSVVRLDPARLAYGVIAGVGFLGAGVIMKNGVTVHGLTTAASLWIVSALGLSVGVGMYVVTAFGTVLALMSLMAMRTIGTHIQSHHYRTVRVTHKDIRVAQVLMDSLVKDGVTVLNETVVHDGVKDTIVMTYNLRFRGERNAVEVYELIRSAGKFDRIEIE